jgi:hypothetical protein
MVITEKIDVRQFEDDPYEFMVEQSFSIDEDDIETWVVVEHNGNELSLSLKNWKLLVKMGDKLIKKIEQKKSLNKKINNLKLWQQKTGLDILH